MSCILLQKYFVFPFLIFFVDPFFDRSWSLKSAKSEPQNYQNRLYRRRPQTCFEYGVTQYGVDGGASQH